MPGYKQEEIHKRLLWLLLSLTHQVDSIQLSLELIQTDLHRLGSGSFPKMASLQDQLIRLQTLGQQYNSQEMGLTGGNGV